MKICIEFPIVGFCLFVGLYHYLAGKLLYNPNGHLAASNLVSMIACWSYLYTKSETLIISYYWYDLVVSAVHYDMLMVAHHIFTLYAIMQCETHPDKVAITQILYAMKLSDILMHYYKISEHLKLKKISPKLVSRCQFFTVLFTAFSWTYYRFIYTSHFLPMQTMEANVLLPLFMAFSLVWLVKMFKLAFKLAKQIHVQEAIHQSASNTCNTTN